MEYRKTKISLISNTLFLSFSIFLLTFIWINFYTRNLSLSLFLGLIFAIIFTIFYIIFVVKKLNNDTTQKSKKQYFELVKNHLLLSNYQNIKDFIFSLFEIPYIKKITENHYITNNKDIFFFFENEILENQHLIAILKNRLLKDIDIYCINNDTDIEIENININYINIEDIIAIQYTKQLEIQDLTQIKNKSKPTFLQILNVILNKQRSKGYLLYGCFLIFTSLFIPYTIYYCIIGTLLISLSIYSRFNCKYNK